MSQFKVTAQDKDTDFDVAAFKIKNNGAGKTIITGSVEITGSSSVEGISTVSLNSAGTAAKLIIKDDANDTGVVVCSSYTTITPHLIS